MDTVTAPVQQSSYVITFTIIGSFFFMCLLTVYCLTRQSGTAYSEVVRSLSGHHPPPPPAAAASPASALRQKGGGVDSSTINALPLVSYGGGAKQRVKAAADDCPICLSEFEEKEIVKLIPHCRHMFHAECLDTWLASHVSCPLCRTTQFFKTADDEVRLDVEQETNTLNAVIVN